MHSLDTVHSNSRLQERLDYIFNLRKGAKVNWSQEGYRLLLQKLGNEYLRLPPVIHVAGTNGKGSIVAFLKSILEAQGYRVHAYTSPHLINVNERISLSGAPITDEMLESLLEEIWPHIEGSDLSFFEIMTALAFRAFSRVQADVLLLEVGCGGRLDCTNVIQNPISTVISRISMDHVEFLGDTIEKIAAEKAGIMKAGVPCIVGYQGIGQSCEKILEALNERASDVDAPMFIFNKHWRSESIGQHLIYSCQDEEQKFPHPNLLGQHQIWNAGAALAVLGSIKTVLPVSNEAIARGLVSANWPARLQQISSHAFDLPDAMEVWLDSGHNDSAGDVLAEQIKTWRGPEARPVHLIVGMLGRKDMARFIEPLRPLVSSIQVVPVPYEPATGVDILDVQKTDSYIQAVENLRENDQNAIILICGSVYLAGDVLKFVASRHA